MNQIIFRHFLYIHRAILDVGPLTPPSAQLPGRGECCSSYSTTNSQLVDVDWCLWWNILSGLHWQSNRVQLAGAEPRDVTKECFNTSGMCLLILKFTLQLLCVILIHNSELIWYGQCEVDKDWKVTPNISAQSCSKLSLCPQLALWEKLNKFHWQRVECSLFKQDVMLVDFRNATRKSSKWANLKQEAARPRPPS